jgi:hypothetical protein
MVSIPTNVVVSVGRVRVPVFEMVDIFGAVENVLIPVIVWSVVLKTTFEDNAVSAIELFGKVKMPVAVKFDVVKFVEVKFVVVTPVAFKYPQLIVSPSISTPEPVLKVTSPFIDLVVSLRFEDIYIIFRNFLYKNIF